MLDQIKYFFIIKIYLDFAGKDRMESHIIELTSAAHKYGNLNIRPCGLDFFPKDAFGGSTKTHKGLQITIKAKGLPDPIKTDIPTDKKSGRPRWIFRKRYWVKSFIDHHKLRPGDTVIINRIDKKTYGIIPGNNHTHKTQGKSSDKFPETFSMTNEEKRVCVYGTGKPPTKASKVTKNTPLESLNLNWKEKELPERKRTKHVHRLHPYLGKYVPQLVEVFLRKYFSPGQIVLDPFVGSGTTLVQANELGIRSIGYDISAFNVLLSRVKTAKYDLTNTRKEVLDILNKVRLLTQSDNRQKKLFTEDFADFPENLLLKTDDKYLKDWFAPQALRELLTYHYFIETGEYQNCDLLKIILTRSARSARLTTHFDLDFPKHPQKEPYWCYKHSGTCKPTKSAFKFLHRYSLDTIKRIEEYSLLRTDASVEVYHGDSRNMDIPPIDGVITSPPYVGLIDYHEQHAYSYHLLGLRNNGHNEIGPAYKGRSIKAKKQYKEDVAAVFRKAINVMSSGGHLIVVANDRDNLYDKMADLIGTEVEGLVKRHVNRRTGRRAGNFYESIFIWKKP
jgi:DNA modification methylase